MNRREIKLTAHTAANQAGRAAKLATLVFLLCRLGLYGLQYLSEFLINLAPTGSHISDALAAGARNLVLTILAALVIGVISQLLSAGYGRIALNIHRGEPVSIPTLLEGFQIPLRVIALDVLRALLLIVWSYAVSLPVSFLLAVPMSTFTANLSVETQQIAALVLILTLTVIIMLVVSLRYWGALFILLDHPELTPWQCLRTASAMTKNHRMELFLLSLSLLPWMLLCALTAGILLIWKMPYFAAVYAGAYEELDRQYREKLERIRELRQQFPTSQLPPEQM